MARGLNLKSVLSLDAKAFKQGLNNIQKQIKGFGNFLKGAFAIGSITAFGKQMINVGKDFEDSMARVQAVSNATTADFQAMQKEAQRLGETTRYTASEAASALEMLTRNGMSAKEATKALSGVLQLAQANAIGLAEAADIITNSLNMFGLGVEETTRVNDVLSATAGNTATNISLLYEALVNAAPAAKVLGFSIEETSAAIGALAQKGVKGADAGTQLRMALTKMADPNIVKRMQAMGVAVDEQSMKEEGLIGTIEKLKNAQLSLTQLVEIFSQRGAVGVQQLISAYDDLVSVYGVVSNAAGTTNRMFEQGVGSVRKELDTLKSAYEGLLISISQKTSGAVKSAIRLLQNLIGNFKTLGGTVMNIASVAVPLLAAKFVKVTKDVVGSLAKIKAAAVSVRVAMGDWVTIIATLVTWVGTALVGAWNKANAAMNDAKKEVKETNAEIKRTQGIASNLISTLGPDSDSKTLAGVAKKLCELFPDMGEAINDAFAHNDGVDDLKKKLEDIVSLQAKIMANSAKGKLLSAQTSKLGNDLYGYTANKVVKQTRETLKSKGYTKDDIKSVFQVIADAFVNSGSKDNADRIIGDYLNELGVNVAEADVKHFVDGYYGATTATNARKTKSEIDANNAVIDTANAAAEAKKFRKELENEAIQLNIKFNEKTTNEELQSLINKAKLSTSGNKSETAIAKVDGLINDKNFKIPNNDKLADEIINEIEIEDEKFINDLCDGLSKLQDYKYDIGKILGSKRDTTFDYMDASNEGGEVDILAKDVDFVKKQRNEIQDLINDLLNDLSNGEFNGIKGEATSFLDTLNQLLDESTGKATSFEHALNLAQLKTEISDINKELQENTFDSITELAQGMNRLVESFKSIAEVWGIDDEVFEGWTKFFTVINAGIQIFETFKTIIEAVKAVENTFAILRKKHTAEQIAENAAVTTSEGVKASAEGAAAAAGAGSAVAGIPIVGPALAVAAIGAVVAAIVAGMAKFADGGIVGGSSYSGDHILARVNSGEGVLTAKGVNNLQTLYNNQNAGINGEVQFKIKGSDLIGVINNEQRRRKG